jgi:RimJ/RimL family protein N-acetyltransferase
LSAVVLESERLRLRGHTVDDFESCCALWADPQVVRHISGKSATPTEVWARLLRYVGHWQLMGYGFWLLEEKATGRFLGEMGFGDFHRAIVPPLDKIPEGGWSLATHAQGKGYALEGMRTALRWMDGRAPQTVCMITPANKASIALAEKLGYVASHPANHDGDEVTVYARSRA